MAYKTADFPFWLRLIVVITLCLLAINLLFFAAPLTAVVSALGSLAMKDILVGLGTLLGTFFGAWLAFRFAEMRAARERVEDNIAAGNRALFTLTCMWNEIKQHQKEIVDPYRGKRDAWLNLHVSQPLNENYSFDMKELSFLLQSDGVVFQSLFLEETRFRFAGYLIHDHRTLTLGQVWPRLEAAGFKIGQSGTEDEIKRTLGPSVVQQ